MPEDTRDSHPMRKNNKMSENYATMHEIIVAARNNTSRSVWNYVTGAAETETTLRRNRHCLDCHALRPRILRDVREIDTGRTFMGHNLRIPCLLAPIGSAPGADGADQRVWRRSAPIVSADQFWRRSGADRWRRSDLAPIKIILQGFALALRLSSEK